MLDFKNEYLKWINSDYTDDNTKNELKSIADNENEINYDLLNDTEQYKEII